MPIVVELQLYGMRFSFAHGELAFPVIPNPAHASRIKELRRVRGRLTESLADELQRLEADRILDPARCRCIGEVEETRSFGATKVKLLCTLYIVDGAGYFTIDDFSVIEDAV